MTPARFLLSKARDFSPDDRKTTLLGPRSTLHHVAIATELALKAFLAHHDATDDWLASDIRHDLALAWAFARMLGLDPGDDVRRIVDQLDPHFRKGGFLHHADFWTPGFEREAPALLDRLIARIAMAVMPDDPLP